METPNKLLLGTLQDQTPIHLLTNPDKPYWKNALEVKGMKFFAFHYINQWDRDAIQMFGFLNIRREDIIPFIEIAFCLLNREKSIERKVFGGWRFQ